MPRPNAIEEQLLLASLRTTEPDDTYEFIYGDFLLDLITLGVIARHPAKLNTFMAAIDFPGYWEDFFKVLCSKVGQA